MPRYSIQDQNGVVLATFTLHYYIRSKFHDSTFKIIDENPLFVPPNSLPDVADYPIEESIKRTKVQKDDN